MRGSSAGLLDLSIYLVLVQDVYIIQLFKEKLSSVASFGISYCNF